MKKKTVSMFMGLVLGVTTVFSSIGPAVVTVSAAESGVTDSKCKKTGTPEPAADDVVPDANQYKYQKDELAAFCHFGPNTFNEIEWGEHYGNKKPSEIFKLDQKFDANTMVRTLKEAGFKKLIITAKHHDGFCIWPSKWTDYDTEEAGYKGDILAEISREHKLSDYKEAIMNSGYICMSETSDRISFNKGYTENGFAERVYHLHLRYIGDNDEVYFRDYLIEHTDVALEYERMKLELWKKYEFNRDGYTNSKTDFIQKYTEKAKLEYGDKNGAPLWTARHWGDKVWKG